VRGWLETVTESVTCEECLRILTVIARKNLRAMWLWSQGGVALEDVGAATAAALAAGKLDAEIEAFVAVDGRAVAGADAVANVVVESQASYRCMEACRVAENMATRWQEASSSTYLVVA
jgi:hypothetical protein